MDLFFALAMFELAMAVILFLLKLDALAYAVGAVIMAGLSTLFALTWIAFTWRSLGDMVPPNEGQAMLIVLAAINAALAWYAWLIHGGQYAETSRERVSANRD